MEDCMEQASSSTQFVALLARPVVLLALELAGVGDDVADDPVCAWDELPPLSFPSMSAASSLQLDPRWSWVWRGAMAFPSLPTMLFRAKPVQKSRPPVQK